MSFGSLQFKIDSSIQLEDVTYSMWPLKLLLIRWGECGIIKYNGGCQVVILIYSSIKMRNGWDS